MAHRRFISAVGGGLVVLLLCGTALAAGPYAYVTHYGLDKVSVVDTTTGALVASIDVGSEPNGVATIPGRIYVTNSSSDNVSVIDAATNTVVATIPVGSRPFGIAADPSGERVWVANQWDGTLSVIDTATNQVSDVVDVGTTPFGVAVHPAGTWVLVTSLGEGALKMVSPTTLSVAYSVGIGPNVGGVAVSPDGTRAWVPFQNGGGRLAVVDTDTRDVTTVAVGSSPFGVAIDPDGSRVYLSNPPVNALSVVDGATAAPLPEIPGVGWGAAGLTVHPDTRQVWVANEGDSFVAVVDPTTSLVTKLPVEDAGTSFGVFIASPAGQGCDDGLQAAVEQGLATVEAAMRRWFHGDFTVKGDTAAARIARLGNGVKGLSRGHLMGVYHNLLRAPDSSSPADPQICDAALETAVQQALATAEGALQGIDRKFRLPGNGMVARLQNLADAVAGLDRGRLQGLYWTLR